MTTSQPKYPPIKASMRNGVCAKVLACAEWLAFRAVCGGGVVCERMFGSRTADRFGILMYHRVSHNVPGAPKTESNVTPSYFAQQLKGLQRRGYQFVSLSQLLRSRSGRASIPAKAVAITFDDGYQSVCQCALPILRQLNIPATVFVCTGYVDSPAPFPFDNWGVQFRDRVPEASYLPLTRRQCLELAADPLIELGVHTHTHEDFRRRPQAFRDDLVASVDFARREFGISNPPFAFPYGSSHDGYAAADLVAAARSTEVKCALTTDAIANAPIDSPFHWGRFSVFSWDNPATLSAKLAGWYSWAPPMLRAMQNAYRHAPSLRRFRTQRLPKGGHLA